MVLSMLLFIGRRESLEMNRADPRAADRRGKERCEEERHGGIESLYSRCSR